jgi:hypothetical protein
MRTMVSGGARLARAALSATLSVAATAIAGLGIQAHAADAFIPQLINTSTIPANGDVNPYGVAFVPEGFPSGGTIKAGDVLVSNFNDSGNVQGTGTTIVSFSPQGPSAPPGSAHTFFSSTLPGLSTALGVLRGGFVIVGNVPTTNGAFPVFQGALQVIDRHGKWVQTLTSAQFLDGPWDLAVDDDGASAHIFVSNVANGTVSRLDVSVRPEKLVIAKMTTVARGYTVQPNAAAVILGPTGLAFDEQTDTLYVASTADNAIYAIYGARGAATAVQRGMRIFAGPQLRGPLALRFAPNGDLLAANGDAVNGDPLHPSEIVEFTAFGQFVREYDVDASQGGAFGLDTLIDSGAQSNYAVVDDVTNTLSVYELPAR